MPSSRRSGSCFVCFVTIPWNGPSILRARVTGWSIEKRIARKTTSASTDANRWYHRRLTGTIHDHRKERAHLSGSRAREANRLSYRVLGLPPAQQEVVDDPAFGRGAPPGCAGDPGRLGGRPLH